MTCTTSCHSFDSSKSQLICQLSTESVVPMGIPLATAQGIILAMPTAFIGGTLAGMIAPGVARGFGYTVGGAVIQDFAAGDALVGAAGGGFGGFYAGKAIREDQDAYDYNESF